jgi:hypothetical protein
MIETISPKVDVVQKIGTPLAVVQKKEVKSSSDLEQKLNLLRQQQQAEQ